MEISTWIVKEWFNTMMSKDELCKVRLLLREEFMKDFYNIWSDSSDILSKHYTGAGSILSQVTRNNNIKQS